MVLSNKAAGMFNIRVCSHTLLPFSCRANSKNPRKDHISSSGHMQLSQLKAIAAQHTSGIPLKCAIDGQLSFSERFNGGGQEGLQEIAASIPFDNIPPLLYAAM